MKSIIYALAEAIPFATAFILAGFFHGVAAAQEISGSYTGTFQRSGPCFVIEFLTTNNSGPASLTVSHTTGAPNASITIRWEGTKRKSFGCDVEGTTLVCDGMWGDDLDGDPIPFSLTVSGDSVSGSSGLHTCGMGETNISFSFTRDGTPPDDDDDDEDESEIFFWNTGDGAYTTAENWEPEGPPGGNDTAVFDQDGEYTVSLSGEETLSTARVDRGFVKFSGGGLTVTGGATPTLGVGNTNDLTILTLENHALRTSSASLAQTPESIVQVSLDASARLDVTDTLLIGAAGSGALFVNTGSEATCSTLMTADTSGTSGSVRIQNPGSTLTTGLLQFSSESTGSLDIHSGGAVNVTGGSAQFGVLGSETVEVLVSGIEDGVQSTLDVGTEQLRLGVLGIANMVVEDGARASAGSLLIEGSADGSQPPSELTLSPGPNASELTEAVIDGTASIGGLLTIAEQAVLFSGDAEISSIEMDANLGGFASVAGGWDCSGVIQVGDSQEGIDFYGTLELDNAFILANQLSVFPLGEVTGTGMIAAGTVMVQGTVDPGLGLPSKQETPDFGTLTFEGDVQLDGGAIVVDVGGTQDGELDTLDITGNASFSGASIVFNFVNGYAPSTGETIPFLEADGTVDLGDTTFSYAGAEDGFEFEVNAESGMVMLEALNNAVATTEPEDEPRMRCAAHVSTMNGRGPSTGDVVILLVFAASLLLFRPARYFR